MRYYVLNPASTGVDMVHGSARATRWLAAAVGLLLVGGVGAVRWRSDPPGTPVALPAALPPADPRTTTPDQVTDSPLQPDVQGPATRPKRAAAADPRDRGGPERPRDGGLSYWGEPDGRPGYSTGLGGCAQHWRPGASRAPAPGLRFELQPVLDTVRPGDAVWAYAVVTNGSDRRVRFSFHGLDGAMRAMLVDRAGRPRSGFHFGDVMGVREVDLAAGESAAYGVMATSAVCGDTIHDPDAPLPAGDYRLVVAADWYPWDDPVRDGEWVSGGVPVRLDPAATRPPCPRERGACVWSPYYMEAQAGCVETDRRGADYGAGRDLTLRVELDSASVRRGTDVPGAVVIRNDGDTVHWLTVEDVYGDGLLRGAGGPLGDGSALLGAGGSTVGGRQPPLPREHPFYAFPDPEAVRLDPGQSVAVPVRVPTLACSLEPLTAGDYRVSTGVYVAHFGWWPAPDVAVTLTD